VWRSKRQDPFEAALSQGHSRAWAEDWSGAADAYEKAAELRPQDPLVHMSLGLAYLRLGRTQEALDQYQRADRLHGGDPVAKTKVAELYERLGKKEQAAQTFLTLAELYRKRGSLQQAIQAWKSTVRLSPDLLEAHRHLAAAFRELGQTNQAVEELLAMATLLQAKGDLGQAVAMCREARELAPQNVKVREVEELLRPRRTTDFLVPAEGETGAGSGEHVEAESPVDEATHLAVARLAEKVFEEPPSSDHADGMVRANISALIAKALAFQKQGLAEEAIRCYEEIISAGYQSPELLFNLGRLYQETLRLDEAVSTLSRTVDDPELAMASHFALGQCYQLQGHTDRALDHFLEAVKIVDLATVNREQADDLIQLYQQLAESYAAKGDTEKAMSFANALEDFLSRKGWEDKALEARQRIQILPEEGATVSLAELLESPGADDVIEMLSTSQKLAAQGQFVSATDVCYWAISRAPDYLPIHMQLAEILVAQGRIGEAVDKYLTIARVYTARGHVSKAVATCKRALQPAPTSVRVHSFLIELLIRQGEIDEAIEHYLTVADIFYRMADLDRAIEKYQEAFRLAPRGSPDQMWGVRIQRELADIYLQRLDWPRVVEACEYILAHQPDDLDTRLQLLDMYTRLGEKQKARVLLDSIADHYVRTGKLNEAIEFLEAQAELVPTDQEIRLKLSDICVKAGHNERAVDALSQVLQLQLEANHRTQAAGTLRRIIALNPPNVSGYRKLLASLDTR
jgi:tetratricopeptide (TPR) repeat protein